MSFPQGDMYADVTVKEGTHQLFRRALQFPVGRCFRELAYGILHTTGLLDEDQYVEDLKVGPSPDWRRAAASCLGLVGAHWPDSSRRQRSGAAKAG